MACEEPTLPAIGPAYDPALPSGEIYRWPLGRTVRVWVDTAASPGATDLRAAATRAIEGWQRELYYRDLDLGIADAITQADIVVRVAQAPRRVGTAGCAPGGAGAAGVTFFCRAGLAAPAQDTALTLPLLANGPGRVKVEIAVDPSQTPAGGLVVLVAHELGHALGIGRHSGNAMDLMHASPGVARPSPRDGETLRWVLRNRADLRL